MERRDAPPDFPGLVVELEAAEAAGRRPAVERARVELVEDLAWACSAEGWARIRPLLPPAPAHPLGCHRPRVDDRRILAGLLLVERAGWTLRQVEALGPRRSTVARRHAEWRRAGVPEVLRRLGLLRGPSIGPSPIGTKPPPEADFPDKN